MNEIQTPEAMLLALLVANPTLIERVRAENVVDVVTVVGGVPADRDRLVADCITALRSRRARRAAS